MQGFLIVDSINSPVFYMAGLVAGCRWWPLSEKRSASWISRSSSLNNHFEGCFTRNFTARVTDKRDPGHFLQALCEKEGLLTIINSEQGAREWMSKVIECDHAAPSIHGNLQTENTSQRAVQPYVYIELPFVSTNIMPDVSVVSASSQPNDLKRLKFFCGNSILVWGQ